MAGIEVTDKYISAKLPQDDKYRSIAFPPISTGIFGYPVEEAAQIIVETVKKFVKKYPKAYSKISFVFLDPAKENGKKTAPVFAEVFNKHLKKK